MCMQDYMKIMEVNHQLQRRLCVCVCVCVSGIPYIMSCHKNSNKVLFDLVGTFFGLHYEKSV